MPHPPEPFVTPEFGDLERAIIIPWSRSMEKCDALRYALRSIEKNFEDKECPIYILGDNEPLWYEFRKETRVKFLQCWMYETALLRGVTLAKEILWTNDDICFLRPVGWDDFRQALCLGPVADEEAKVWCGNSNTWRKGLGRAFTGMRHLMPNQELLNFSTHTPYLFEREKALEVLRLHGTYHKMPMESLYHNTHMTPWRVLTDEKTSTLPSDALFLNHRDDNFTPELQESIKGMFPDRMKWELNL